MFSHQVIDDIKETYTRISGALSKEHSTYMHIALNMARHIRNAQHFHLSDIDGLIDAAKRYKGSPLFIGDLSDIRLPYKSCWFDYHCNDSNVPVERKAPKRGLLALEIKPDLLNVFVFAFSQELKRWAMGPQGYIISIGKPMKFHPDVVKFCHAAASKIGRDLPESRLNENIWLLPVSQPNYDQMQAAKEDAEDLSVLNLGLLLLSCKNIGTEKHVPPEALNKKRKKQGKQELFTYHTLIIKPTGKRQESIPKHIWENRIHLCRGHFKTYTIEKPLFGELTGRFWWQAHVRGKNRDGIVMKDYVVNPI